MSLKDEFILDEIEEERSKLVYFNSPVSIYKFAVTVLKQLDLEKEDNSLTQWCDKYISDKWLVSEMLKRGIGIHHGKLPNFMRRYIENLYNDKELKTIFCTSTLLKGINTPTNELLVYDSNEMTAFKINNLIGRVGRLSSFQKGQVYLFDKNLEKYLLGDEKYEEVSIVAETNEIVDLEEVIYLNKATDELSTEQMSLYNKLQENLKKYGKTVEDLQKTDGFVIAEFLRLEDIYGLTVSETDGEVCLKVNVRKGKEAAHLYEMLCAWKEQADRLSSEKISREEYDNWRYHYPKSNTTQRWAKVPSQKLNDALAETFKNHQKDKP